MTKLPEAPKHEGVDPLTNGKSYNDPVVPEFEEDDGVEANGRAEQTVVDQKEHQAKANTPDAVLPDSDKTTTKKK